MPLAGSAVWQSSRLLDGASRARVAVVRARGGNGVCVPTACSMECWRRRGAGVVTRACLRRSLGARAALCRRQRAGMPWSRRTAARPLPRASRVGRSRFCYSAQSGAAWTGQ